MFDTDLNRIYWRLKENKPFFTQLCNVLDSQMKYDSDVWGYGIEFEDDNALKKYLLMRSDFITKLEPYFESQWLGLYDDILFNKYTHLEYIPLVNSRAHLLGQKRQILKDKIKKQYQIFLKRVSYRSTSLTDIKCDDKLAAIYYLLLQDRISETLFVYNGLDTNECKTNSELTYDYLTAYMSLYHDSDDEKEVFKAINIARDIEVLLDDLGCFNFVQIPRVNTFLSRLLVC